MAARQRAIVRDRINDGALFPSIFITIAEKIGVIAGVEQGALREATKGVIARIRGDADLVLITPRPSDHEVRSAGSMQRLKELAEVVEALKVDIRGIGEGLGGDDS